jgi:hypothetical protein
MATKFKHLSKKSTLPIHPLSHIQNLNCLPTPINIHELSSRNMVSKMARISSRSLKNSRNPKNARCGNFHLFHHLSCNSKHWELLLIVCIGFRIIKKHQHSSVVHDLMSKSKQEAIFQILLQ